MPVRDKELNLSSQSFTLAPLAWVRGLWGRKRVGLTDHQATPKDGVGSRVGSLVILPKIDYRLSVKIRLEYLTATLGLSEFSFTSLICAN